ncbi:MAG: cbb3-type cytochrome oxidase assembly protein [Myxococcota bacterium]
MTAVYVLIWGSWLLFGITAVWALVWAAGSGQFRDPEEAARSIFDDDEPVGVVTDRFPGEEPKR